MKLSEAELKKVMSGLCYHDKRNPDADPDVIEYEGDRPEGCMCDNCFYGKTWFANKILELVLDV
jgi:hypothetical protein